MTQEELLWKIIAKLNDAIASQHETIEFLMDKRLKRPEWVGLTEEEVESISEQADHYSSFHAGVRFATARLKEKNT